MKNLTRFLFLTACWLTVQMWTVSAQSPFGTVDPTGKPYTIVVADAEINLTPIASGSWIGVFDGAQLVGTAEFSGSWPLSVTAWEGDASQGLDGFKPGNTMAFKVRAAYFDTTMTLDMTAVYSSGNGTFGSGAFSAVRLDAVSGRIPVMVPLSADTLDAGSVNIGAEGLVTIQIRNDGKARLRVVSVQSGNAAFVFQEASYDIAAGSTVNIPVRFVPTLAQPYATVLTLNTDDLVLKQYKVAVKGQGLPALHPVLATDRSSMPFGYVPTGETARREVRITNTGNENLVVQSSSVTSVDFAVNQSGFTLKPGESQVVAVTYSPPSAVQRNAELVIRSNQPAGDVRLPLSGTGYTPWFGVAQQTGLGYAVTLQEVQVDQLPLTTGDQIGLFSGTDLVGHGVVDGSWPLSIMAWKSFPEQGLPGFSVGDSIIIKTNPLRFGERATVALDSLVWSEGDGRYGTGTLAAVKAYGFSGRAPRIRVDDPSLFYGPVVVGAFNDQFFWVYNTGGTSLNVNVSASAPFSVVGSASVTVASHDSVRVQVRFQPQSANIFTGTLTVSSNDPFSGGYALMLQGRGVIDLPSDPLLFEIPDGLLGLPMGRSTMWDIRVRNPFSESFSGTVEVSATRIGLQASLTSNQVTVASDRSETIRTVLTPGSLGSDTLVVVIRASDGREARFLQPVIAYESMFEPVPPTGLSYTVVITNLTTVGRALATGDEIALLDGDTIVGTGIFKDANSPVPITAWQADAERSLDGFVPGRPIGIRIAKMARGYEERQILHTRRTTFAGNGVWGEGVFESVEVTINEPPFFLNPLKDDLILADAFTSRIWARLDTVAVDPDGGLLGFSVSTNSDGLTASILNSRIVLSLVPGFVGAVDLFLTVTEGPYSISDTVRINVVGRLAVQVSAADVVLKTNQSHPVSLLGEGGLFSYAGNGELEFSVSYVSGNSNVLTYDIRQDTLWLSSVSQGEVDLRVSVSESYGQFTYQDFRITVSDDTGPVSVDVNLSAGWNMVGLPFVVSHQHFMDVFSSAMDQTLYRFASTYVSEVKLSPQLGYWIRLSEAQSLKLQGEAVSEVEIALTEGWNLVSGIDREVTFDEIDDPGNILVISSLYGFNGTYFSAGSMKPGYGYWVRSASAGAITLLGSASASRLVTSAESGAGFPNGFSVIRFFAGDSGIQRGLALRFAGALDEGVDIQRFLMPPLPPQGVFDARFEGDLRYSEESVVMVHVQRGAGVESMVIRIGREVQAKVDAGSGDADGDNAFLAQSSATYRVTEFAGSLLLADHIVDDGQELVLSDMTDRLVVEQLSANGEVAHDLPAEFALEQNFPNPFNPSTTIRYALPEAAQVRLEVYTVAGQRVAVLASGEQRAGWHTVAFDGSSLASGVYIYRLEAGGFVQTRKLMLIK
jgi:hypothetical protein